MERIKVDKDKCIGCGACTAIASDVFSFNDEGYAQTDPNNNIIDNMEEEVKNDCMDALEGCPVDAIYKEEVEEEKEEEN